MNHTQIKSDTCTYNRKLRRMFHNIGFSTKSPQGYLRNYTLIKTGTIGLLSCATFLIFAIIQYSFLQSIQTSENITVDLQYPAATSCNCDCDNFSITSSQKQNLVFPEEETMFSTEELHVNDMNTATTTARNNYSVKKQLKISESIWKRSVTQRHAWISTIAKNNLTDVNPWDGDNYVFFWNYFPPSFNCPHSVQRVGFIGDGGKWVCGLELYESEHQKNKENKDQREAKESTTSLKPSCIIYSFGVANESSFEAEMLNRTSCQVFAFDYSVKNIGSPVERTNPRVTFKALGIGNKNLGKFRTLKYFMDQNGHEWIDILKMDIEGGEYSALDKVMQDFPEYDDDGNSNKAVRHHKQSKSLPFGQLLLEVHVDGKIFPKFYEWWERLEARGLRAYYSEVNHVACALSKLNPNFVEYSFLNIRGAHRLLKG